MKIALIGYGKMGQSIERIALEKGHEIVLKIGKENLDDFNEVNMREADVAIEFTMPEAAFYNVTQCLKWGIPVISGTTGWNNQLKEASDMAKKEQTGFLHASNFSLGVNLFFAINEYVAKMMKQYPEYDIRMEEVHHTAKKDAPSGTAISIAEKILGVYPRKNSWRLEEAETSEELAIIAKREENVPGTHTVEYLSTIDSISLTHTAHSREGFAKGAVMAAEYIKGKQGVFTMNDVLGLASTM